MTRISKRCHVFGILQEMNGPIRGVHDPMSWTKKGTNVLLQSPLAQQTAHIRTTMNNVVIYTIWVVVVFMLRVEEHLALPWPPVALCTKAWAAVKLYRVWPRWRVMKHLYRYASATCFWMCMTLLGLLVWVVAPCSWIGAIVMLLLLFPHFQSRAYARERMHVIAGLRAEHEHASTHALPEAQKDDTSHAND
jgi:hypothetical protein